MSSMRRSGPSASTPRHDQANARVPAECSARSCAREREPGSRGNKHRRCLWPLGPGSSLRRRRPASLVRDTRLELTVPETKAAPGVVPTYLELREELLRRDRSLRDKVVSLEEAASFVRDGDSVGIGGSTMSRTPMGMIWALIRAGRKGLTCSRSITSSDGDLLLASGVCDHIITSWFSQSILWGVSKVMRHHVETGKARFDEWSHMAIGMRFRAGAMGVPFMPIRSMLGSDVLKQRPEAKEIECPFTGEKLLLVPALNPDVALIHVQRCDAYGNAQMDGLQFMDIDLAMAANKVILTTERIVSNDQIRRAPDATKIPFFAADAVVDLPFGCAPHECYGIYEPMLRHMEYYVGLVNKEPVQGMEQYLQKFIYGPKSWSDFLALIGVDELLEAARAGQSLYDA